MGFNNVQDLRAFISNSVHKAINIGYAHANTEHSSGTGELTNHKAARLYEGRPRCSMIGPLQMLPGKTTQLTNEERVWESMRLRRKRRYAVMHKPK